MSEHRGPKDGRLASATGLRFAIVAARFNAELTDRLVAGAEETLIGAGAAREAIETHRCPGSLEIPGLARRLADSGRFAGIIGLGVVIRGDTMHFELVAENAVRGLADLAAQGRVAIGNCILACETLEQAHDRAGGRLGNRGADAAEVVIELANQYARIPVAATGGAR